jgi:hypothetical protein
MRLLRVSPLVLVLASLSCSSNLAQQKPRRPKIVFEAKSATNTLRPAFGQSCKATPNASSPYYHSSFQPVSIADLLRAPAAEVKILRYGPGWKNQDDIRERLLDVLGARTLEISGFESWDEFVPPDIVARIQFVDKTQGALEVSGVHVCFTDHSGAVIWTRIGTRVIEKRN